jgi:hypothetical protein
MKGTELLLGAIALAIIASVIFSVLWTVKLNGEILSSRAQGYSRLLTAYLTFFSYAAYPVNQNIKDSATVMLTYSPVSELTRTGTTINVFCTWFRGGLTGSITIGPNVRAYPETELIGFVECRTKEPTGRWMAIRGFVPYSIGLKINSDN